jgi:hypothetical protein
MGISGHLARCLPLTWFNLLLLFDKVASPRLVDMYQQLVLVDIACGQSSYQVLLWDIFYFTLHPRQLALGKQ